MKNHLNKIYSQYKNSDFVKKIVSGTFFLVLGNISSKILMAGSYLLLARIVSPEEYGEFGMIKSTVNNFLIFSTMGIGLTTTKFISEYKSNNPKRASGILGTSLLTIFLLGLLVASVFIVFSDRIAIDILESEKLAPMLKLAAFILVFSALYSVQIGSLLGLQSYKSTTLANIAQGLFVSLGLIIGGYLYGVNGAVAGNLIGVILVVFIVYLLLRKETHKFNISPNVTTFKRDFKEIYSFALPASLSTLITSPTYWVLNTMLVRTEDGYKSLGIYSAVIIFSTAIQMLNGSLNNVLLPIFLSKETQITHKKEFFNYYGAWIASILIATPFILFPEIISFFLGDKYPKEDIIVVLGISILSTLIIANRQGVGRDLVMKNKMWISVFSMGQWAITTLICFYFLRPYGAIGFAASIAIGYSLNFLIFIPVFVKLKITDSYILYNKWIYIIWLILITIIYINQTLGYLIRIPSSLILIAIIIFSFYKLFHETAKAIDKKNLTKEG